MSKKKLNRRDFLKVVGAGTCSALASQALLPGEILAHAASAPVGILGSSPLLIVVNLAGGVSYNAAPIFDGWYYDENPTLRYRPPGEVEAGETAAIPLTSEQGLHPSLTAMSQIWNEGNLALLNLVGYPSPNRSHANSADIWYSARRDGHNSLNPLDEGWAGRLTCQMTDSIFSGVALGQGSPVHVGSCNPSRVFGDLAALGENSYGSTNNREDLYFRDVRDKLIATASPTNARSASDVRSSIDFAAASIEQFLSEVGKVHPSTSVHPQVASVFDFSNSDSPLFEPSAFVRDCRDAAWLVALSGLKTRFLYLERTGFDTHDSEKSRLTTNLNDINLGLDALITTLKNLGRWNDTVILTMSEFSRTFENGNLGTDHGHAAPMFMLGGRVSGGIKSLTPLPENVGRNSRGTSLRYFQDYHIDFRQVLEEVIVAMGYDADAVITESFASTSLNLF